MSIASSSIWLVVGLAGQVVFVGRFLLQWFYSERRKRSVIPMAFWYASLLGGAILLAYAIYKRDPVFIVGQAGGLLVYLRNLQFRLRERRQLGSDG
ncbi:MAG: lipid-A-disaccharide synthase N-terminal domain-containing protein [Pseudomonadota bacterium]|nr:lipid-A-disaccharide synthase N-terminal domain-containing protein [Xanthomonadaceae bacterium]MDE3071302.1 lipid-A-disaccharide synthase N-terminal domain-containing protein [Pseudomonadota bacterium]